MAKKNCCDTTFRAEAIISIDERGQMVLPKDLRERAKLRAGDKLAVMTFEQDGECCCLCLVKTDALTSLVKGLLGPMMQGIADQQK